MIGDIVDNVSAGKRQPKMDGIHTSQLKIRRRTLIFEDEFYALSQISKVSFVDLTVERKIPKFYWALSGITLVMLLGASESAMFGLLGVLLLCFTVYLFVNYYKNKTNANYGLYIESAGQVEALLYAKDKEFVQKIVLALHKIIEEDLDPDLNINFETLKFEDHSTNIETNVASPIVPGHVSGNVVSNIN